MKARVCQAISSISNELQAAEMLWKRLFSMSQPLTRKCLTLMERKMRSQVLVLGWKSESGQGKQKSFQAAAQSKNAFLIYQLLQCNLVEFGVVVPKI